MRMLLAFLLSFAATTLAYAEKLKVAFVYVGPVGDLGWTYTHDQGRKHLEKELTGKVETAVAEKVQEGADAERVIRDFARKGYQLIFTTSFGYMDPTLSVAKQFPKTTFVHISGVKTAKNVSTVFGRIEEPFYVSGFIAGAMSKKGKVGFVAAHPIPEVIRNANAFALGVRAANPQATVNVIWTNTWYDPVTEKEAAVALLDAGCDVLGQDQDTAEPQKAAEARGALGVGYHTDMSALAPKAVLTSPVWNWGPKYTQIAKSVLDGKYESESYWGGWKDGIVDLAPLTSLVPAAVQDKAGKLAAEFKSGTKTVRDIFKGPLKDNTGKDRVPSGQSMTDPELLAMDWLVEGVVGNVPRTGH
jgi:basic membrane protein A